MEEATFGGKMELLKLSKLKLQLRALISELNLLRDRERSASDQLHLSLQNQKRIEEEFSSKLQELESELASSVELRQKLERKVSYLQNDNALLENKQKELKGTIQSLLQSREQFINAYQDSTCELKRSMETRDRKLSFLSEKLKSHILLFESIEKEVLSVNKAMDNVRIVLTEREEVVNALRRKMAMVSEFEKVFIEKISEMESRLKNDKDELERKDRIISELESKLEAEKIGSSHWQQIEELQKAVSAKDLVTQNLISEKEALALELRSLGAIVEKIQNAFTELNQEDKKAFSSILEAKERCDSISAEKLDRGVTGIEDVRYNVRKDSEHQASLRQSAECTAFCHGDECDTASKALAEIGEKNDLDCHVMEPACSTPQPTYLGPQSPRNTPSILLTEAKSNCIVAAGQFESDGSTAQVERSEHPG